MSWAVQEHNKDKTAYAMRSLQAAMKWDEDTFAREYGEFSTAKVCSALSIDTLLHATSTPLYNNCLGPFR